MLTGNRALTSGRHAGSRNRPAGLLLAIGLMVAALGSAAPLAAADKIVTRGGAHADFGRIVFDWSRKVDYEADVVDGRLVVTFAEPLDTSLTASLRQLSGFVADGRIAPDGRTVSFDLRHRYRLRTFRAGGTKVVVDMMGRPRPRAASIASGALPGTPVPQPTPSSPTRSSPTPSSPTTAADASAARAPVAVAASGPLVAVKFGDQQGYSRLVFDWVDKVGYQINRGDDRAVLSFDRPARLGVDALRSRGPRNIADAVQQPAPDGVMVTLAIPASSRLRHFRSGSKVVLDVFDPTVAGDRARPLDRSAAMAARATRPVAPAFAEAADIVSAPDAAAAVAARLRGSQVASLGGSADRLPTGTIAAQVARGEVDPHERPIAGLSPSARPQLAQAPIIAPSGGQAPTPVYTAPAAAPAPTRQPAQPASPTVVAPARQAPVVAPAPSAVAPSAAPAPQVPDRTTTFRPATQAAPRTAAPAPSGQVVVGDGIDIGRYSVPPAQLRIARGNPPQVDYAHGVDGGIVAIRMPRIEPLAVFKRGGFLYIVVGDKMQFDWSRLLRSPNRWVADPDVETFALEEGTIARLRLTNPALEPTVELYGRVNWVIRLQPMPTRVDTVASYSAGSLAGGGPAYQFTGSPGQVVLFSDDGDDLAVVPIANGGFGVPAPRRESEFALEPSAQGLVIRRLDTAMTVAATDNGTRLFYPSGVSSDDTAPGTVDPEADEREPDLARLFPLERWRGDPQISLNDHLAGFRTRIAAATGQPSTRTVARWELARFQFAHGLYPETLGLLRLILEDDDSYLRDRVFQAMRGVAAFMSGDPEAAAEDLAIPELDGEPEAELWRGQLAAELLRFEEAADKINIGFRWIEAYPKLARQQMYVRMADAALRAGQTDIASLAIDALNEDDPWRSYFGRGRVLRARQMEQDGQVQDAIAILRKVNNELDQRTYAFSNYYLTDYEHKNQDIGPDEAIERFERLAWAWRDALYQFNVQTQLGELYRDKEDYRKALQSFRRAVSVAPGASRAPAVEAEMRRLFTDLYLNDKADSLSELSALALFDEFRELTPVGPDGDIMIRKLADRLIRVDLLDRAAILLEHQIKFRLTGVAAAEAGRDLAEIQVANKRPGLALTALDLTAMDGLEPALDGARRLLQAEALAASGRPDQALDTLLSDVSPEADLLRAAIAWDIEDWDMVAESYARLVGDDPLSDFKIDPTESDYILRWAIALSLGSDYEGLDGLRARFGAEMINGANADAFELISGGAVVPGEERSITEELAEIANFENFMSSFREQLRQESTVN